MTNNSCQNKYTPHILHPIFAAMDTFRSVLELIYFGSAGALAVIAAIGLRQLTIAKNTAKMAAMRESYKLAADKCAYYLAHIIPLLDSLELAIQKHQIKWIGETKIDTSGRHIKLSFTSKPNYDSIDPIIPTFTAAMNSIEAFSVFFVSGVADEKLAFSSVGSTYCNSVRSLLPLLLPVADNTHYQNVLKLFTLWNSRLEAHKLELDRNRIQRRLQEI